jgi:urea transport system permease protein
MKNKTSFFTALLLGFVCFNAQALTQEQVQAVSIGDNDTRVEAIQKLLQTDDKQAPAFLQALLEDAVKVSGTSVLIVKDNKATDPISGAAKALPTPLEDVVNNNRVRGSLEAALAAYQLSSSDSKTQLAAIKTLEEANDPGTLPRIEAALKTTTDSAIKTALSSLLASLQLASPDPKRRLSAIAEISKSPSANSKTLLNEQLKNETDADVKTALTEALKKISGAQQSSDWVATAFTGVSLGSILLLVALGLAITYGLMGVINMAHGELMMIGAYATYLVQVAFKKYLPGAFDWYLLLALPVAFFSAALVGAVLERTVIRRLYGRPLETLLATWGISLILIQLVRTLFGAQNVGVENPSWMSGSWQVIAGLNLPWNRVIIVLFAAAVLLGMVLLLAKTRLGLFVRGVTQNRPMAQCLGVNTARVDTYAFALGSGIAGLAGCALSQVGNVGPDLGQGYIVDAFMVVVTGGVGQIAGTVYAALGLGFLNKFLEGITGAVLAKITVLICIIAFIQKRPSGLFALKGRQLD